MEEQEHLDPTQMTSSWAGAFGQTQFVPSAFLQYAVDGDGDGKRDLWHSAPDALASTANLLADAGWKNGRSLGLRSHACRATFPTKIADVDTQKSLNEWRKLGVTGHPARSCRTRATQAAIFFPPARTDPPSSSSTISRPCC